jgi:SAM-dependent methyltransferase
MTLAASVAYVRAVVADYLRYGGWEPADLAGKRVLEIGTGDSLAVARSLRAAGARSVTTLDAWPAPRDEARERALCAALDLDPQDRVAIEVRTGAVERAAALFPPASFDLIVSRAVLEHVADLEAAWRAMTALLSPGGAMWHKVDLRHHGYYAHRHPLHFLTIPEPMWRLVSSPDPTLNRARRPDYARLAGASFARASLWHTHVLDRDEITPHVDVIRRLIDYDEEDLRRVEAIRPRLQPRFRALAAEDLLITGIFLCCAP